MLIIIPSWKLVIPLSENLTHGPEQESIYKEPVMPTSMITKFIGVWQIMEELLQLFTGNMKKKFPSGKIIQ